MTDEDITLTENDLEWIAVAIEFAMTMGFEDDEEKLHEVYQKIQKVQEMIR
jgi:hypothetical protein